MAGLDPDGDLGGAGAPMGGPPGGQLGGRLGALAPGHPCLPPQRSCALVQAGFS